MTLEFGPPFAYVVAMVEPENLVLAQLREVRAEMREFRADMERRF